MISVTRLNHSPIVLNCELIEYVETTPDTVISLTTGEKLMVLEPAETIVERVIRYRRSICAGAALEKFTVERPASRGEADLGSGQYGQR
jgi:flagellar protein FlbD